MIQSFQISLYLSNNKTIKVRNMKTGFLNFSTTFVLAILLLSSCMSENDKDGSNFSPKLQAISLFGDSLFSSLPGENTIEKYELVKSIYYADKNNADNLIWLGRWTAYKGDYLEAINIFEKGIEQFPEDARFYRHRAHRYISIRKFELAIQDLEYAMTLIENQPDQVELDGMPNAMRIPISSLHSNIRYHLGLAYYLTQQYEKALAIYQEDVSQASNDDKLVSTTHWLYMTLRLLGREADAAEALKPITEDMNVIENFDYLMLLQMYKGDIKDSHLLDEDLDGNVSDGMAYGIANWYFYNGEIEKAKAMIERILSGNQWASFGHIAAEADQLKQYRE